MQVRSGLNRVLEDSNQLVLTASPGAGKTTMVPLMLLESLPAEAGRIIVAQPRRVAVRSAASYVASLLGEPVGETVGWRMRADTRVSASTRIEFTTTGTLLRRLLADPDLVGVSAVIIDEVHERHLDADLSLAFALDSALLRDDLRLIAMSATADAARFQKLLGDCPLISVETPPYPLETKWVPFREAGLTAGGLSAAFLEYLASVIERAFNAHGSALAFVDSIANTTRLVTMLTERGVPAFPLHGQLSAAEQDTALSFTGDARVIVATEIAETSLTVPGVNCVVDAGVSRVPRFEVASGTTHLVTVGASQSAMQQRAGRANRTGPGVVYRAFSESDYARALRYAVPEILAADLTEATLLAYAWSCPADLQLLDAFPVAALARAEATLRGIGALETAADRLQISASGRILSSIPTVPQVAHGLLSACVWGVPSEVAARVAAVLSGSQIFPRAVSVDSAMRSADPQLVKRFKALVTQWGSDYTQVIEAPKRRLSEADWPGLVVGAAYPQRICRVNPGTVVSTLKPVRFTSVGGTGFEVEAESELASAQWLAAASVQGVNGVVKLRLGAEISEPTALFLADAYRQVSRSVQVNNGVIKAIETVSLGALPLHQKPVSATDTEVYDCLAEALQHCEPAGWISIFKPTKPALQLADTCNYLHSLDDAYPQINSAWISENLEIFLGTSITELSVGRPCAEVDALTGLRLSLGWETAMQIEQLVPRVVKVPSGREVPVTIDPDRGPTISVKLQECFGWRNVPTILGKQISIELLSPAGRPLAVTGDLTHFFNETYVTVRAEMRGRYPKHPWPEDPWQATATVKTNRVLDSET
ncbi:putative ATP-dependent helicase HrpB [Gleimia coleocanis DSM 15436]|uniref:Putative ATP-dependent helicase HrpB n=2 Tax=Gleimia TaxID=2692113 RepID=C0W153_9ACTO|nr:putative ATP-dependent helicase HrpB [Gleimia coleocanis DSM 15436]